ncbi:MAG TPA: phosphoribosylaminoimidazolesuccinocarboxamide synthase [Acidimicrobiia bacterium]|nr:phosphoribosylaminoimidazolesuccinocarboxamide synthase [Acidimicrobiia bacterium]
MTKLPLAHVYRGKVRDLYEVDHDRLLIVASDRISVFDVVLEDEIPDKGRVLTGIASFWFDETADVVPNHVISCDPTDFPETAGPDVAGRAMLVRTTRPIRLECIARGYLFGGAWSEYRERGTVQGRPMPAGMQEAERLPEPLFTPTTKAETGHDQPLSDREAAELVGADRFEQLRDMTLALYRLGAERAAARGVILADTKVEFGEVDGELLLIDEILTPDSSRYWPADEYRVGASPPSFDKQYVRDYYLRTGWDRQTTPAPRLPDDVITGTRARYVEAYELLTERSFDEWFAPE